MLLDRIAELETNPAINPGAPIPAPPFTAFPKSLLSNQSQKTFVANLRLAIEEYDREDPDVDPILLSRHVGPQGRKREEPRASRGSRERDAGRESQGRQRQCQRPDNERSRGNVCQRQYPGQKNDDEYAPVIDRFPQLAVFGAAAESNLKPLIHIKFYDRVVPLLSPTCAGRAFSRCSF